jgi:uncharacterized Fe-S cluster-containing protein
MSCQIYSHHVELVNSSYPVALTVFSFNDRGSPTVATFQIMLQQRRCINVIGQQRRELEGVCMHQHQFSPSIVVVLEFNL